MPLTDNRYVEEIQDEPLQPKQSGYNISSLGGRDRSTHVFQDNLGDEHEFITKEEAIKCVEIFFNTQFEGGRHTDRINKIACK
mgnify:CR=1 FL=1